MGNSIVPNPESPYQLAAREWQTVNRSWIAPELSDIADMPETAAAATVGRFYDRTGLTVDAASLDSSSLAILLMSASVLADMSGWVRADIIGHIMERFKLDGIEHMRQQQPSMYKELLERSGCSATTLKNCLTTYKAWAKSHRRPALSFTHHMVLNPLSLAERLVWAQNCEAETWSVAETRYRVAQHQNAETIEDSHRWDSTQKEIDTWSSEAGIKIDRTDHSLSLRNGNSTLTFTAVVLPSGRAAIQLKEK